MRALFEASRQGSSNHSDQRAWDANAWPQSKGFLAPLDVADDVFASMDPVTGTPFADTISGDESANVISGLGGADTISGGGGDDVLYGHSAGATGEITATVLASGLDAPVAAAVTAADPGFLYVVGKGTGVIWRVDETTGARTTFLDIPNAEFSADGERGVLGLAFHPNYQSNGRFFVFLTDPQGDLLVREYHRSSNPAIAETTFSQVIEIPKQTGFSNHNGGWIGFSPSDGYLYISTGDGGGGGDPGNNAQNINSLLGKLLRIDVNSDTFVNDPTRNYAIPASNPFASGAGADEIWAYGLRNPWRVAFDPRNGDIYIADVGQERLEELNYRPANAAAGANFGWRVMEGTLPYPPGSPNPNNPALLAPIHEYGRLVGGTIIGGEVYVGPDAGMTGHYVFADFISDRLFSLFVQNGVAVNVAERTSQITGADPSDIVDFVSGVDGQLYAVGIGGTIWRLDMSLGAEDLGNSLSGGAGNDQLYGGPLNDMLNGGADNDYLDGGGGLDTAVFSTPRASNGVFAFAGLIGVVSAAANETDRILNVETLQFSDQAISTGSIDEFNAGDYLAGYDDLLGVFGRDLSAAFDHWIRFGYLESRPADNFANWDYLASHDDLIQVLGPNTAAAARHYIDWGFEEGRARDSFANWEYLASHDDLIQTLGSNAEAAARHYVESGFDEGRSRDAFSNLDYIASHADLIQIFGLNADAAAHHYVAWGFAEGRARDAFDAAAYLANYDDLRAAYGDNEGAATVHFILYGFYEGRTDDPLFG